MKIKSTALVILLYATLSSCSSDELTISKAESILKKCQKEQAQIKTRKQSYGLVEMSHSIKKRFPNFMRPYRELEKLGIFNIGELQVVNGYYSKKDTYKVSLTSKGEKFLMSSKKESNDKINGTFKTCEYKLDKVTEIHEIPEKNIAKVKIKIVRFNETPFLTDFYEKKSPKEIIKTITYRKTNDGWKLCD